MFRLSRPAKRRWLIALAFLVPALVFLLYPLGSPRWEIVFDADKIRFREQFLAQQLPPDSTPRPNIVILLADDLGKTDISLYGNPYIKTPNIDAIGEQGVTFDEGYITSPICSPSRAGLMTGRYQQRYGFELHVHERYPNNRLEYYVYKHFIASTGDWRVADSEDIAVPRTEDMIKQGLPPTEFALPELLRLRGYRSAVIGKWHLGYNPTAKPLARGFDYHYGFYEAFSLFAPTDDPNIAESRHEYFSDKMIWKKGRSGNCAIVRNDSVLDERAYLTDRLADEACQWLRDNHRQPFLLYVPFSAPHTPFQAPKSYVDELAHFKNHNRQVYYAMIRSLDEGVGRITATLRELGLEENTLVFFLSDNGGATYTHATTNAPLRGGKLSNFEGGINVPFMLRWKGVLPEGSRYSRPVSSLDIFATSIALARVPLPDDRPYDGVNLLPYLLGERQGDPHAALYWRSIYHKALRRGNWKLLADEKAGYNLLFRLDKDKEEHWDVAALYPDTLAALQAELARWEQGLVQSAWPRVMDYHIRQGDRVYYFPL